MINTPIRCRYCDHVFSLKFNGQELVNRRNSTTATMDDVGFITFRDRSLGRCPECEELASAEHVLDTVRDALVEAVKDGEVTYEKTPVLRVLRVVEYVGDPDGVASVVKKSLHEEKLYPSRGSRHTVKIRAKTIRVDPIEFWSKVVPEAQVTTVEEEAGVHAMQELEPGKDPCP